MTKKGSKSSNSQPAPASSASGEPASERASHKKLTVKTNENSRRSSRLSIVAVGKESKRKSTPKLKLTQKKKPGKSDARMPKKPPTAFFYFLEDFRKDYQQQNPDVKSMREIGKACGETWKKMTYEEKVKYYDIATEKRAEFDRAMAEYTKEKESGDFQDSDDDSEFSK